jgi:tetratricopeptide (TPR) repeat protein
VQKTKGEPPKPKGEPPKPKGELPKIEAALQALRLREIRAWVDLFVRLLILAFLRTILVTQYPSLRAIALFSLLFDTVGLVVLLWPFFIRLAKNMRWRIALGQSYSNARRWEEASRTLAPLALERSALLDASGEGRYLLALALEKQGNLEEARKIYQRVQHLSSQWGEQARAKCQ